MANALTNNLVDYTKPASKILVDKIFGGNAYKDLTVMSGVKYKEEIALMSSDVTIQANGCGITPNEGTTIDPKYMQVANLTVEQEQCFIALNNKYLSEGKDIIPSMTASIIDQIQLLNEAKFWNGTIAGGSEFDGVAKLIDDSADVVDAGWAGGAIDNTNVDDAVALLIEKAPQSLRSKKKKVIFVSPAIFLAYKTNRLASNVYVDAKEDYNESEMQVLGHPSYFIRNIEGLDGNTTMFMGYAPNIYLGVDELSQLSTAQWKVDEYNKLAKFVAEWKIGAQIVFDSSFVKL